ncbi:MAG: GNAT family N-acetyltransferase [Chloroflexi bacterium]|nr:GNAT family N-acetyltransferase [Chloroflexota bacterium]
MITEIALKKYPIKVALGNERTYEIRPLERSDKASLHRFFTRIPEEDRFYLKENVTAPEVVHDWIEAIDPSRVVSLVALDRDTIVADATLHRSRAPARRHVGELRVVVDPEHRGAGLGSKLIQELIDLGRRLELDRLFFELVDRREQDAISAAIGLGFEEVAVLRGRVKDSYGSLQDLAVLELSLDAEAEQLPF